MPIYPFVILGILLVGFAVVVPFAAAWFDMTQKKKKDGSLLKGEKRHG